jgi:hypothetical protein
MSLAGWTPIYRRLNLDHVGLFARRGHLTEFGSGFPSMTSSHRGVGAPDKGDRKDSS